MTSDQAVARLRRLDICDLSDAIDALGLPPAVTGLRPLTVAAPIAGRAVTVKLAAGPAPEGSHRHLGTAAVEAAGADDLILVEQASGHDAAGWGGLLSRGAKLRGIAGTIVEGPARDIEEAARLCFPVYARSATARTARGRIHEAAYQVPVTLGGIAVAPGDYIAADRSGCVVIAAAEIERVLAAAERIAKKSDEMAAALEAGMPVSRVMGGEYETLLSSAGAKK